MFSLNFKSLVLAATTGCAWAIVSSVPATAATVTQLIHFDDVANNGQQTYSDADGNFLFDPTNFQSSVQCADTTSSTGSANGNCVIETNQGVLPTMTRLTGDKTFSLDSFYFLMTGNQSSIPALTVQGFDSSGTQTGSVQFALGTSYTNVTKEDGSAAGSLDFNTGYFADLTSLSGFDNLKSAVWLASNTNQTRLDCVVSTFSGSTSEPASGFSGSCGGISSIPVPAGLPLLLTAMGLGGFMSWRKHKAV